MSPQYILHPAHELAELVEATLCRHCHHWARTIEVRIAEGGDVQLTGRVTSYYHKQMAQEVLRQIQGVARIRNDLCVDALAPTAG